MPRTYTGETAVVPLMYGTRSEFSVVYRSEAWEEVLGILEDPVAFMRDLGSSYSDLDRLSLSKFVLHSPVNVRLGPLDTLNNLQRLVGYLDGAHALANWNPYDVGSFLQQSQHAFVVELALETRIMTIAYNPARVSPPSQPRFKGNLTEATIGRIQRTRVAHVHFDLALDPMATQAEASLCRAQIALDFIERPGDVASSVTAMLRYDYTTSFVSVNPTNSLRTTTNSSLDPATKVVPTGRMPSVVLDSVISHNGAAVPVCGDGLAIVNGNDLELVELLLKPY